MSRISRSRVLAIGLDAAEPTLIRQLIEDEQMPALKSLSTVGQWLRVESPAYIGSGSVWPTFLTGEDPAKHGIYGEWCWQPRTMSLTRFQGNQLVPFWKPLEQSGLRVGVFDIPFAPLIGLSNGFEISEWGPHDTVDGEARIGPHEIARFVSERSESHPYYSNRFDNVHPHDYAGLEGLGSASLKGVKLRGRLARALIANTEPDLSIIVFSEIHHAGHHLWHTIESHPQFNSEFPTSNGQSSRHAVKEICLEVDRQIEELVKTVGEDTTVLVFSLHGMRPTIGVPAFLAPLLCQKGFARLAGWEAQSWTRRAKSVLASAKRHTPEGVKKLYYQAMPRKATHRLAQTTMLPPYDWTHTRAFSLPSDQHGWIRINLIGREAQGCVTAGEYESLCTQLEELLLTLTTEDGKRLVRNVTRTARGASVLSISLPDLVVHWEDAAFSSPLRIIDSGLRVHCVGKKFTGQHSLTGFCILRGHNAAYPETSIQARDLSRLITKLLGNNEAKDSES